MNDAPGRRTALSLTLSLLAFGLFSLSAASAQAADFYGRTIVSGGGSSWEADANVQGGLTLGFEFADIVGIEGQGRVGFATVDSRIFEVIGIGTKLAIPISPFIPHLRLGFVHQHEESIAGLEHDGASGLVGVGEAIRHRSGFESGVGVDWAFLTVGSTTLCLVLDGYVDVYPDSNGPVVYGGAGAGLGLDYEL